MQLWRAWYYNYESLFLQWNKKVTASFFKSHNSDFFVPEFVTIQWKKKKHFVAEKLSMCIY